MISIKKRLIPLFQHVMANLSQKELKLPTGSNAVIFLTADYGNIGDLAINSAQEKFIKDALPDYSVTSITVKDTYRYLKSVRRQLKRGDIIFLQGGGSFGDLYPKADFGRLFLVGFFKKYKIISFPQTMVFGATEYGKWRRRETQRLLSRADNVTLFAREKITYDDMRTTFNDTVVKLSPDIVLSLFETLKGRILEQGLARKGIVMTLRTDEEKRIAADDQASLITSLTQSFDKVTHKDTAFSGAIPGGVEKGDQQVDEVISLYSQSQLVVTDRLHGMILAAISGTPCIVLPNSNHKISETYKNWLTGLNYIAFFDVFSEADIIAKAHQFTNQSFRSNYDEIAIDFSELANELRKASTS